MVEMEYLNLVGMKVVTQQTCSCGSNPQLMSVAYSHCSYAVGIGPSFLVSKFAADLTCCAVHHPESVEGCHHHCVTVDFEHIRNLIDRVEGAIIISMQFAFLARLGEVEASEREVKSANPQILVHVFLD